MPLAVASGVRVCTTGRDTVGAVLGVLRGIVVVVLIAGPPSGAPTVGVAGFTGDCITGAGLAGAAEGIVWVPSGWGW
jgi:hypothetical protein